MAVARTLMVQGTASSVGKSLLVTALCRYFRRKGLSVAPFKGLNMALNAHVTPEGFEIARAQAVQAEACDIEPAVEMNPLLLKPESNSRSQVILMGRPSGSRSARELFATGLDIRGTVVDALATLRARHDLVLIEGAGSPAEINLRSRDVANMFIARAADAPVLLAGDIDRGGVFAAFVGTLALLEPEDRARVRGFLVNKFRGDVSLLQPGLDWLHEYTGIASFGVLPHMGALRIAEEDSLNVDARMGQRTSGRAADHRGPAPTAHLQPRRVSAVRARARCRADVHRRSERGAGGRSADRTRHQEHGQRPRLAARARPGSRAAAACAARRRCSACAGDVRCWAAPSATRTGSSRREPRQRGSGCSR